MMNQHVALVKGQIAWLRSQIARYTPDHPRYRPDQVEMYQRLVRQHEELLAYLEGHLDAAPKTDAKPALQSSPAPAPAPSPRADLSDLPPELLAELSDSVTRGDTDPLIQIINERGGTASIDDILIDLFRKRHEVGRRILVSNKLYRLSKRGLVWPLPGKKGLYTTTRPDDGIVSLFGRGERGQG